jgi:acetyl-CoA C-acetyltransferase
VRGIYRRQPATASNKNAASAAALIVDERAAEDSSPIRPDCAQTHAAEPRDLFIAPVGAIEKVLAKAALKVADIDLFELNEAFASQCLACMRPLGIDHAKLNVNGGAIALGHPIGASGARVLVTLLHALADRKLRYGLAALCLGGGEAVAMIVERM